jgi:hypothetical protein
MAQRGQVDRLRQQLLAMDRSSLVWELFLELVFWATANDWPDVIRMLAVVGGTRSTRASHVNTSHVNTSHVNRNHVNTSHAVGVADRFVDRVLGRLGGPGVFLYCKAGPALNHKAKDQATRCSAHGLFSDARLLQFILTATVWDASAALQVFTNWGQTQKAYLHHHVNESSVFTRKVHSIRHNRMFYETYHTTALVEAAHKGHLRVVQTLVRAKADVNKSDAKGALPLCVASALHRGNSSGKGGGDVGCGRYVLLRGKGRYALLRGKGRYALLRVLLRAKADVNARDRLQRSPLYYVVEGRASIISNAMVKSLVHAKAAVDIDVLYCALLQHSPLTLQHNQLEPSTKHVRTHGTHGQDIQGQDIQGQDIQGQDIQGQDIQGQDIQGTQGTQGQDTNNDNPSTQDTQGTQSAKLLAKLCAAASEDAIANATIAAAKMSRRMSRTQTTYSFVLWPNPNPNPNHNPNHDPNPDSSDQAHPYYTNITQFNHTS